MGPFTSHPPVILFGYDVSPFTNKVRLALRIKQIPFTYIRVPVILPRPLLTSTFGIAYRKIPILAIGREIYCDTSLIIEAIEHFFPATQEERSVYPPIKGVQSWTYRGLVRGFASFWTDRPLFRTTTGFIPSTVWSSSFGQDRAQLIGHALSPEKLQGKLPLHLSNLDLHLSLLEPVFRSGTWALPTTTPSLADISLWIQIRWGIDMAAGRGISDMTGGKTDNEDVDVVGRVFNEDRYPGLMRWFKAFEAYIEGLPDLQVTVEGEEGEWKDALRRTPLLGDEDLLVPTAVGQHVSLDTQRGLVPGAGVSVVPDDTGRGNPTVGTLVKIGSEEVAVKPDGRGELDVRAHFPRLGFVVKTRDGSKL